VCNAPNGIVFLYDPTMIVDVPSDTGAGPILATKNCVSIWTIHEDDGQVEITISDDDSVEGTHLRFSGEILTESGRVAFNDSRTNEIIGIDTGAERVFLRIYSDDPKYPETVFCRIIN
jgi:hypothetical protein